MTRCPSEAPQVLLGELVEIESRRGRQMFVGFVDGRRVFLVRHREQPNARGEPRWIWRLVAQHGSERG